MESTRDEKAMRLHDMLHEALKPMTEKLEKLEEEIKAIRESQEELVKLLEDQSK